MITSKGDIEQSVRRILRKKVYDIEPLVVDFTDNFSAFSNQGKKRETFYKKKKYKVENIIYIYILYKWFKFFIKDVND